MVLTDMRIALVSHQFYFSARLANLFDQIVSGSHSQRMGNMIADDYTTPRDGSCFVHPAWVTLAAYFFRSDRANMVVEQCESLSLVAVQTSTNNGTYKL